MTFIALGYGDVAIAALLVLFNAALSLYLTLGLERRLLVAAIRMVLQLTLIGLVLKALFASSSIWLTAGVCVLMVLFAAHEITARQSRPFSGLWNYGMGAASLTVAGLSVTILALTTQIRPDPWYDPRYAVPLLGMILGNAMTGVSLGLERLLNAAVRERGAIEARLSLGEDFSNAISGFRNRSVRSGLIPIINSMSAAGLVFLPGMMTGQILSGIDPVEAVKYQLLIMFLIAGGTGMGVVIAVWLGMRRLTDTRHRLRLDRLVGDPPA